MNGQQSFRPGLTERECEVLELVACGYSAKEAAGRLDIAPRTVERHIENLRLKMRARNRAHLVARALAAGELSLDPIASPPPRRNGEDPPRDLEGPRIESALASGIL